MYPRTKPCGGRRPRPSTFRRKKKRGLSNLLPAGRELRFKRFLRKKKSTLATTCTIPCLHGPPLVMKEMSSLTISTNPCLDAPLKMSSPHDVTTTTTTMPQSPSSVAQLSSDQF
ncbi:unnamed protein product [Eruca vesicaria subsp. sativa]|uniref:Uncharacterized protein n=1 Tax=Eruca vesicaria subsp. sativa TaxID=29727 RepID=A0ABC8KVT7_ERUVS|nr:unnamed protein product [Eruca vesicaria subsp. sativa]